MPNFVKIGQSFAKILRFSIFQHGGRRILNFRNREFLFVDGIWRAKTHQCTKCCQNWWFRCEDIKIFRIFKMAAADILDFWNREILLFIGVQRVEAHHRAKFCQNRSIGCKDIKIFRFLKMAAVRHLGFVWGIFGPSTVSNWGSVSLCKIWLWSMQ